jgi:hypothetical protein
VGVFLQRPWQGNAAMLCFPLLLSYPPAAYVTNGW